MKVYLEHLVVGTERLGRVVSWVYRTKYDPTLQTLAWDPFFAGANRWQHVINKKNPHLVGGDGLTLQDKAVKPRHVQCGAWQC
jgi:hypothetical protein